MFVDSRRMSTPKRLKSDRDHEGVSAPEEDAAAVLGMMKHPTSNAPTPSAPTPSAHVDAPSFFASQLFSGGFANFISTVPAMSPFFDSQTILPAIQHHHTERTHPASVFVRVLFVGLITTDCH